MSDPIIKPRHVETFHEESVFECPWCGYVIKVFDSFEDDDGAIRECTNCENESEIVSVYVSPRWFRWKPREKK